MIYELSITLANGDIDKIIVDEDGVRGCVKTHLVVMVEIGKLVKVSTRIQSTT